MSQRLPGNISELPLVLRELFRAIRGMKDDNLQAEAILVIDDNKNERTILEICDSLTANLLLQADIVDYNKERISLGLPLTEPIPITPQNRAKLDKLNQHLKNVCVYYRLHDLSEEFTDKERIVYKQYVVGVTFFRTPDKARLLDDLERHLNILRYFYNDESPNFDIFDEILGE